MRRFWAGLLALSLAAPAVRADDKPQQPAAKTPADQLKELTAQFEKEFTDVVTTFRGASDAKAKDEARAKAFKLPETYAAKMFALAQKHPTDPVADEAYLWVATIPASRGLPVQRQAYQTGREKAKSDAVKLVAAAGLANQIFDEDDRTPAQTREAEALYAEIVAKGKGVKDLPEDILTEAEGNLWEIRNLVVGKPAPEAESADLDGKTTKLSDHKGKVVVLDFWATWCGPCVGMIPHERELVKKYDGKPFVFISVSADQKKEALKDFLDKEKMPWTHWWNGAGRGVVQKWNVKAFPTFYVIDAKGVLRAKVVGGGDDSEKKIADTVAKLVKEAENKAE